MEHPTICDAVLVTDSRWDRGVIATSHTYGEGLKQT